MTRNYDRAAAKERNAVLAHDRPIPPPLVGRATLSASHRLPTSESIRRSIGYALIIHLIIQTIGLDPSEAVWTDEASNVSRLDRSGAAPGPRRSLVRRHMSGSLLTALLPGTHGGTVPGGASQFQAMATWAPVGLRRVL